MNETKDFTNLQKREEELFAQFLEKNNPSADTATIYDGDKKTNTGIAQDDTEIDNIKDFLPDFTNLKNHTGDNAWKKLSVFWQLLTFSVTQRSHQFTNEYKYTLICNGEGRKGLAFLERDFARRQLVRVEKEDGETEGGNESG